MQRYILWSACISISQLSHSPDKKPPAVWQHSKKTPSCIETQTKSERHDNISEVTALKSAHLTP